MGFSPRLLHQQLLLQRQQLVVVAGRLDRQSSIHVEIKLKFERTSSPPTTPPAATPTTTSPSLSSSFWSFPSSLMGVNKSETLSRSKGKINILFIFLKPCLYLLNLLGSYVWHVQVTFPVFIPLSLARVK